MSASALFRGVVHHARHRPRRHRLRYRIFQLLLDLDELPALDARLKLFSLDRFNLVSFHARDHLAAGAGPLRGQVAELMERAGIVADGAVRLLCMPRVLGHAFNPLSVFFCHRADGGLAAMLYQVDNTFGERHLYILPVRSAETQADWIEQDCRKRFFVSPFMPMELSYHFQVRRPTPDRASVRIEVDDDRGALMFASFEGRGEPLGDAALLRAWAGAPLLSLKVLGAIHWEALKIWLKRIGLQRRTPSGRSGLTVVWPTKA